MYNKGLRSHGAQNDNSRYYFEKTCSFSSHCILTWEAGWYNQYRKSICIYICNQVTHLCCTRMQSCVLNNTSNCYRVPGLKSFITLICMELKSKAPSVEEGHLNHCQELTAHCTPLPLTTFPRWGLLHCRLSPNSLFSSVPVWLIENSSGEQSLASACERGLSGSQTPVLLHH